MKRKLLPIWITLLLLTTLIPLTTNTVSAASFDTGWVACGTVTQDSSGDKTWGQNENFNVSNIENDDGQPNDIYLDYSAPAKDYDVYLLNETGATDGNDKAYKTYNWGSWDTASYGSSSDTWGLSLTPSIVNNINFGVALKYIYDDDASPKISNFMECSNFSFSIPVGATITGVEVATEVKADVVHEVDYVWMKVYYTANTAPTQSNENPTNGSTNQDTAFTWNTTISDPEGDSMNWSIECSNGQSNSSTGASNGSISIDLTGLSCCENYTVWVNVTDGSIWTNESYWFLTRCGTSPTTTNPSPADASTDQWPSSLSATVEDPEGDTFSWTIETSPDIGSNSGSGTNGSKTCTISQLPDNMEYDTTYTWWVNTTDSPCGNTSSTSFTFTTPYPVETRAPTGEQKYNATLNGWLNYTWLVNTSYGFLLWDWDNSSISTNITVADYDYLATYDTDNNRIINTLNDNWDVSCYGQDPCVGDCCDYDFNGDNKITFLDLSWWLNNYDTTVYTEFNDQTLEDFNYSYNKEDLHDTWHYKYKAWLNGSYFEGGEYHLFTKPTPPNNFKISNRDDNLITFRWFEPETNDPDNLTTVLVYSNSSCPSSVTDGTWLIETSNNSYSYEFPVSETNNWYVSAFTNFTGNYSNATCLNFQTYGGNYTINVRHEDQIRDWTWTNLTDCLTGRHKFVVHYDDGTIETNEFEVDIWNSLPSWEEASAEFCAELSDFENKLEAIQVPATCMYIDNVEVSKYPLDNYNGWGINRVDFKWTNNWVTDTFSFRVNIKCGDEYAGIIPIINVYDGDSTDLLDYVGSFVTSPMDFPLDTGEYGSETFETLPISEIGFSEDEVTIQLMYGSSQQETQVIDISESQDGVWQEEYDGGDVDDVLSVSTIQKVDLSIGVHYHNVGTYTVGIGNELSNPSTYFYPSLLDEDGLPAIQSGISVTTEDTTAYHTWTFNYNDMPSTIYPYLFYSGSGIYDYETINKNQLTNGRVFEFTPSCGEFDVWDDLGLSTNWTSWGAGDCGSITQANFTEWWNNISGNLSDWLDDYGIQPPSLPDLPSIVGINPALGWTTTPNNRLEDPDPHDGKFFYNTTKNIDWVEFIWSESDEIFNISWNLSDYCHRKLVVNDQMRLDDSITFWIRNDLLRSRYGTSIPGLALADYILTIMNVPKNSYAVIYTYDADGDELLIHSEYLKNFQIKPMLIFGQTYYVRVVEPDGTVTEIGEFTTESTRDITLNSIDDGEVTSFYKFCTLDKSSLSDGFRLSFYDKTTTCDWVQFIIYNKNAILVYDTGQINDVYDYDFDFTSAEGYEDGQTYYYQVICKINNFDYPIMTPLLPFYGDNEFDGADTDDVNGIFFFIFGRTPFRTSSAEMSYAYAITFILMMIGLLAFKEATYLGLVVEGFIVMGCSTIFGFVSIQQVVLASVGVFLITLGILAALAGKRSNVGGKK